MAETIIRCPFCAEEILAAAKKCKHCGSILDSSEQPTSKAPAKAAADYGILLLAIPIIASLLIVFWVSQMSLLDSPGAMMGLIAMFTLAGTALLAAMEASKARSAGNYPERFSSPVAWFFAIILLWIIAYPFYLYKRKHLGLPNLVIGGTLIALIYAGVFLGMSSAIHAQQAKVQQDLQHAQQMFKQN